MAADPLRPRLSCPRYGLALFDPSVEQSGRLGGKFLVSLPSMAVSTKSPAMARTGWSFGAGGSPSTPRSPASSMSNCLRGRDGPGRGTSVRCFPFLFGHTVRLWAGAASRNPPPLRWQQVQQPDQSRGRLRRPVQVRVPLLMGKRVLLSACRSAPKLGLRVNERLLAAHAPNTPVRLPRDFKLCPQQLLVRTQSHAVYFMLCLVAGFGCPVTRRQIHESLNTLRKCSIRRRRSTCRLTKNVPTVAVSAPMSAATVDAA